MNKVVTCARCDNSVTIPSVEKIVVPPDMPVGWAYLVINIQQGGRWADYDRHSCVLCPECIAAIHLALRHQGGPGK